MLLVRQRIASQRTSLRLEGVQLGDEPLPPGRFRDVRLDPAAERDRVVAEPVRGEERLQVHLCLEVCRPEIAVDQTGDPLVEPQRKEQVVPGDVVGSRDEPFTADGRDHVQFGTSPMPWPGATPPSSPWNGMPWRSTASRLIRSAAVLAAATSRT